METNKKNVAANVWTARIIPVILAGVVGYATYVLVVLLCVEYLLKKHNDTTAAIAILVINSILFLLMAASFFRLVYVTAVDPPYVALGPRAVHERKQRARKRRAKETGLRSKDNDIGGAEYDTGASSGDTARDIAGTSNDPDSPGLELFYTKDVFTCGMDGKPRWCSECLNWKPDRTHHCSSSGRCIQKMDHFCPWVGGPVGENNFKFFLQFTGYTALYTLHLLIVMSIYIWKQNNREGEKYNGQFAAILGLASFFFLFTAGMTGTSFELVLRNLTQVERLGIKTRVQTIAVLQPPHQMRPQVNSDLVSNPTYHEVTYPLGTSKAPFEDRRQFAEDRTPGNSHVYAQQPMSNRNTHVQHRVSEVSQTRSLPASNSKDQDVQSIDQTAENSHNGETSGGQFRRETQSDRDLRATRTFAVLNVLQPGDNIWDLGSAIANWESVMGYTFLDYLLPIRRSPCCNHENSESHYMIGPAIDRLRLSVGFVSLESTPRRGQRLKQQRESSMFKNTRRRLPNGRSSQQISVQPGEPLAHHDASTEMRHLTPVS